MNPQRPTPLLTIVIPTHNRHDMVAGAVDSALGQSLKDLEVIVVDDGSTPAVELPHNPRLRCIRVSLGLGPAAAQNAGLAVARGRWIGFLDDDDRLLPQMAEASLAAIAASDLLAPVAALSGVEVVDGQGRILERRFPPSFQRGRYFSLEPLPKGKSYVTKNTLVVERRLLVDIGGFDADLAACEWVDLLLRLNPVCSIIGIPSVTYRLSRAPGIHFSRDIGKRRRGFLQLQEKHRELLSSHRYGYADALLGEARMSFAGGAVARAIPSLASAMRLAPLHTLQVIANPGRVLGAILGLKRTG
jgi:glycosyltransferase involved in cell wall biosynthesis